MEMNDIVVAPKPSYLSKTVISNLIIAVMALFVPGAAAFLTEHAEIMIAIFAMINIILRFVSQGKVELW